MAYNEEAEVVVGDGNIGPHLAAQTFVLGLVCENVGLRPSSKAHLVGKRHCRVSHQHELPVLSNIKSRRRANIISGHLMGLPRRSNIVALEYVDKLVSRDATSLIDADGFLRCLGTAFRKVLAERHGGRGLLLQLLEVALVGTLAAVVAFYIVLAGGPVDSRASGAVWHTSIALDKELASARQRWGGEASELETNL